MWLRGEGGLQFSGEEVLLGGEGHLGEVEEVGVLHLVGEVEGVGPHLGEVEEGAGVDPHLGQVEGVEEEVGVDPHQGQVVGAEEEVGVLHPLGVGEEVGVVGQHPQVGEGVEGEQDWLLH